MVARKILTIKQLDRVLAPGKDKLRFSWARAQYLGDDVWSEPGTDATDMARAWPDDVLRTNVKRGDIVAVLLTGDAPAPTASAPAAPPPSKKALRAELKAAGLDLPVNATLEQLLALKEAARPLA